MPRIESILVKQKIPRKTLTLEFEDGDDIVQGIKQAMTKHHIVEVKVDDVNGRLKEGAVNCMEGPKYKKVEIKDKGILRASGTFKFGGGDLWGTLHVFTDGRKPISGTLVSGKAADGFQLKLSFVP